MPKLLVIADDLTGANDVGVQFAKRRIPVLVRPSLSTDGLAWPDRLEVLVVSTESRHLDDHAAAERVSEAVGLGAAAGAGYYYKKTDSTMRGNIGSELEALLAASGQSILPFIPAAPQFGRTTIGGHQFVAGQPLHETVFANDPIDPIRSSSIPTIIARQSRVPVSVIGTPQLHSEESPALQAGIYVFDATTDDDLWRIGAWLKRRQLLKVVAGAAGFAELLPDLIDFAEPPAQVQRSAKWPEERMLVVNGSLNATSLAQIECAQTENFAVFTLSPELLVSTDGDESAESRRTIAGILGLDAEGRDVMLRSIEPGESPRRYLEMGARLGLKPKDVHLRVAENFGRIISRLLPQTGFKIMAVFGGDTLAAIVRAFGWSGLWPQGEIIPGVVASKIDDQDELLLLTKAGGFGPTDLLQQVKDYLRSKKR
jgi:uncharacterized protein YgbK (DUF1537 family)